MSAPPPVDRAPPPVDRAPPKQRSVVMHPRTAAARAGRSRPADGGRRVALSRQDPVGAALLGGLLIAQRRLAAVLVVLVSTGLVGLPLLCREWPGITAVHIGPLSLVWLLLGVSPFLVLTLFAWGYVAATEWVERRFAEVVADVDPPGDAGSGGSDSTAGWPVT